MSTISKALVIGASSYTRRGGNGPGPGGAWKHGVLLPVAQVQLYPEAIGDPGNGCLRAPGVVHVRIHHCPRSRARGHHHVLRWSDLHLRVEHGILAAVQGPAANAAAAALSPRAGSFRCLAPAGR